MGVRVLIKIIIRAGFKLITARLSIWWSDLRFRWVIGDKMILAFGGLISVVIISFSLFLFQYSDIRDASREVTCLALNIYHESRGEPRAGQFAVAEVTMNRVASKHYPNTVCEVVYQQNWDVRRKRLVGMFSWTELDKKPELKSSLWRHSRKIAEAVFDGDYIPKLSGALFYHARYIKPRWARYKRPKARIGQHIFY